MSSTPAYLILGGSSGIGAATAKRLRDAGANLVLVARDESRLGSVCDRLGAVAAPGDATDPGVVDAGVKRCVDEFGTLTGAVNCVGSILLKPAHSTTDDDWRATIRLNLDTAFWLVRAAAKQMQRQEDGGSVVLMSSCVARHGIAAHEAIAAAKGGIQGLALAAGASYASKRIRFNVVAPGLTDTPMGEKIVKNEAALNASKAMTPNGRIGSPEQVASAICWLLDPEQAHVTGQTIGVDGGMSTVRSK